MTATLRDRTLTVGQVDGWRAWRLRRRGSRVALVPNGRGAAWPPRRPAVATCWRVRRHRAPEPACTCGLYAVGDPAALKAARSPAVVGTVALWGTVVEHALGYRGQLAYPQRLALVCHICLFQRGIIDANPDVVAAHRDGALVPLCLRHHRLAVRLDVAPFETLSAATVLAALNDAYAVEPVVPSFA